jgi:hypothetical protein
MARLSVSSQVSDAAESERDVAWHAGVRETCTRAVAEGDTRLVCCRAQHARHQALEKVPRNG